MYYTQYRVRVGNTRHKSGVSVKGNCVFENENYNPDNEENYMAILKLSTPLNFSSSVAPITLEDPGDEVSVGTAATVSGWGVIFEGSRTTLSNFKAVDVIVISNDDCANKHQSEKITSNMMCAQAVGYDISKHDSDVCLLTLKNGSHNKTAFRSYRLDMMKIT